MRFLRMIVLCAPALLGQSFEVATIKPSPPGSTASRYPSLRNGTLMAQRTTLKTMLSVAYGKIPMLIFGDAGLDSDTFDLSGKAPEGVADSAIGPMLQALLKERFDLEAHLEMREMPVFEMVPAKDGVKLKAFDPAHPPNPVNRGGGAALAGVGTTAQLANFLANPAGRPVIDKVGISERVAFVVYYAPMSAKADEGAADLGLQDIFTAVQQQLGVRLQARKEAMEVVVVDRVDRLPGAN